MSEGAQTKLCRCSDDSRESETLGREGGGEVYATDTVLMRMGGEGVVEFLDMECGFSELMCLGGAWVEWAGMPAALCRSCIES